MQDRFANQMLETFHSKPKKRRPVKDFVMHYKHTSAYLLIASAVSVVVGVGEIAQRVMS